VPPFLAPPAPPGLEPAPAPSFTVVIAAYQAATTIGEAVASALGQTAPPHQVVVCDDGSSDDLAAALAPFAGRLTVVTQAHAGTAAAKNTALAHATGDFVAILDADDVFAPRRLELLGALAAARPDLDVVASDAWFEDGGTVTGRFYDWRPFPVADQRRAILEWCFVTTPAVRRSRLEAIGGFDPAVRHGSDWDCWLRLVLGGSRVGAVGEPLLRYRRHGGGLTGRRLDSIAGRVQVLEKALRSQPLTSAERTVARASLAAQRARLLEERAAVAEPRDATRLLLTHAVAPGVPARTRVRSAARAVATVMRGHRR
jgi:glycosyltransferase involved in cell wall biosynthesis